MERLPLPRRLAVVAALLAAGTACFGPTVDPDVDVDAVTVPLLARAPARVNLPPHNRPSDDPPPERIPMTAWTQAGNGWRVPTPIRPRSFYFFKPPPGMQVLRADGEEIRHRYFAKDDAVYWTYDADHVTLHGLSERPGPDDFVFAYPLATGREAALNLRWSGEEPEDFLTGLAQSGPTSRAGLRLSAPAEVAWTLEVPPRGELRFHPALIAPEILDGPPSDGATLSVVVEAGGAPETVWSEALADDTFRPVRVDLSRWSGETITLALTTDPGETSRFDYVFVADPVVLTPKAQPRRYVLVFVDTLRPDHLGAYGYDRATSPALDAQARRGVVFEQARSIAPWTLPSARTVLTGRQPEDYFDAPTLQGLLGAEGYATAMFGGNLYLGPKFGLNRDWGLHYVELLPDAEPQLDRVLAWLDQESGRDALLLVHLMDVHLPYKEPDAYRGMFDGPAPPALDARELSRAQILRARPREPEVRQHVRDRYDNNLRYTDDQLARLYDRLGPNDVLVFFSDHGEEFWEHNGFEHGHTLYDELLQVPLVMAGPGLPAGARVTAPVSLLDVTPTVLDLAGLEVDGFDGRSLVSLAQGEPTAVADFGERDQAFGRPLYGHERWGVLHGGKKYTTTAGREELYDLDQDPAERRDKMDADRTQAGPYRAWLGEALGREFPVAFRLENRIQRELPDRDLVAKATFPGGVRTAWVGEDPTDASKAVLEYTPGEETVVVTWPERYRGRREVWVVPSAPIADVSPYVVVELQAGEETKRLTVPPGRGASLENRNVALIRDQVGGLGFELGFGLSPVPEEGATQLSGSDAEITEALKAMGYLEE